jgi:hypothetical protein
MSHRDNVAIITVPRLPRPGAFMFGGPRNVVGVYVNQLVSALEDAIDTLNGEQFRTFTELNLSDLQGHGGNLRIGDVFQDGGILKIVRSGDVFVGSFVGTTAVGTVTVSTP